MLFTGYKHPSENTTLIAWLTLISMSIIFSSGRLKGSSLATKWGGEKHNPLIRNSMPDVTT